MQLHKLTIVCDGSRSPSGRPEPVDIAELAAGAELLLAANAYFYTEGCVPRDRHPGTGYFSVGGGSSGDVPRAYEAWVRVLASEVYDPATYSFRDQLLGSITAWERGDLLYHPPEFARAHAALPGSLYSAIWEREAPIRTQVLRLSQRTAHAMDMLTRSAAGGRRSLRLILDGAAILHLGRSSLEQELTEYSRKLRALGQVTTGSDTSRRLDA
jgi:hypothetical protein